MSQSKVVRFYEPVKLDQNDKVKTIDAAFWSVLFDQLEKQAHNDRTFAHGGADYHGAARTSVQPARRYLYAGRLRDKDDWPDGFDPSTGTLAPLTLNGLLFEPTYLVPFGANNYAAVMSPQQGGMRQSSLESWLTAACGLTTTGDRIELRPILDNTLARKLASQAEGVTRLSVRMGPGADLSDGGGGELADALRSAQSVATDELSTEITLSLGHSRGTTQTRRALLQFARWVASRNDVDKAELSMLVPQSNPDGQETLRSEIHNLLKDRITYQARIPVPAGQPLTESSVMSAIEETITRFNQEN